MKQALKIKPDYAEAQNNLGNVYEKLGEYDLAAKLYQKIIDAHKNSYQAYNNLGIILQKKTEYKRAEKALKHAIMLNPKFVTAYNNLGIMYEEIGRYNHAAVQYEEAVKLAPHNSDFLFSHAKALLQIGKYSEAIQAFDKFLILKPESIEAICHVAVTLFEIGKNELAFKYIRDALTNYKENEKLLHVYAQGLAAAGETAAAIITFEKVLKSNNSNKIALANLIRCSGHSNQVDSYALFQKFRKDNSLNQVTEVIKDQDTKDIVALMSFGRSGSLFLHSLLDGHPSISTLPGYYFKGWFNQATWNMIAPNLLDVSWRERLVDKVYELFEPQFNAKSKKNVIGTPDGHTDWLANNWGFNKLGPNEDESLVLDKEVFKKIFTNLLMQHSDINPRTCFNLLHEAFDLAFRENSNNIEAKSKKIFYHIHNPNNFEYANFLNHYPEAKILYIMRRPTQMLESWITKVYDQLIKSHDAFQQEIWYYMIINKIIGSFHFFFNPLTQMTETKALKLEDLKEYPEITISKLTGWLGIDDHPSVFLSQFLNYEYSRPSSNFNMIKGFDKKSINAPEGRFFPPRDTKILDTLFWPVLNLFNYSKIDQKQFEKDLNEIRPWLDVPLQFELNIGCNINSNSNNFSLQHSDSYKTFHQHLLNIWNTLNKTGTFPHLFEPLKGKYF